MKILSPTKQRRNKKKIIGFDIETYGQKNKFYMASLFSKDFKKPYCKVFYNKDELIKELMRPLLDGCIIVATNLAFDLFGTFKGTEYEDKFNFCWSAGKLLSAKMYIHRVAGNSFPTGNATFDGKSGYKREFIDTMNYACLSVEKMGKILNLPKLEKPKALGKIPRNEEERKELEEYNIRDSEISYKFLRFLYDAFYDLGATPKITIAGTAMSLFRNKYLKENYYVHDTGTLKEIIKSYYGGRTEVLARGKVKDVHYYDFNSLYPTVMRKKLPNPNTLRTRKKGTINNINQFEGFSKVKVYCPKMKYPLLPSRFNNKLVFPIGTFTGWYSHVEIREAIGLGYKILEINKQHYFKETIYPLKDYATDLYKTRLDYKKKGSPMEYVTKILLNSLYGKFGQKFYDRDSLQPFETVEKQILEGKLSNFIRIGKFVKVKIKEQSPSCFCFPEWASYITAYARIKLHRSMRICNPIYVDTDSLVTKIKLPTGNQLGDLKEEAFIEEGYFIKPKLYAVRGYEESKPIKMVKAKGVMKSKTTYTKFVNKLFDSVKNQKMVFKFDKFVKFRESLKRNLDVNEIIEVTKELNIEDEKRIWKNNFQFETFEYSNPIRLLDGEIPTETFIKSEGFPVIINKQV